MNAVPYFFLSFACVYIAFQLVLFFRLSFYYKAVLFPPDSYKPFVSILIAARDEEKNIIHCLRAIHALQYPKEKIEVWIGDDQSADNTFTLVANFIRDKPNYHLVSIQDKIGKAKGKANVLAHLARKASGEFLFITDADIEVPPYWIEGLLAGFDKPTIGIVSGSTVVKGNTLSARIQRTDWAYAFGMVHVVSEMNMPVTAVGNNMAIRKTCYESTGGYENVSFSVTEDLELFKVSLKKGWGYRNLLDPASTAFSAPVETFKGLLHQRKRWTSGAFRLPVLLIIFLTMQAIYFPVLIATAFFVPWIWLLAFWLTIYNIQSGFIDLVARRLGLNSLRNNFLLFELNRYYFPVVLLLYRLLPIGIEWKGRVYKGKDIQP
jgi:1,2-diacylglycerol 3-beta-glucosyltransferase